MSAQSRRSILSLMGMGAAGSALVNTEIMASDDDFNKSYALPGRVERGLHTQLRIADALENLARSIRDGSCAAIKLDTSSSIDPGAEGHWLTHDVHVTVELLHKEGES